MKSKKKRSPTKNSNPLLSVANDCTVLYSNKAGEPLLNEWDVKVGEKVPSSIAEIVRRIISLDSPEKFEINVGNKIFLVVFSPLPEKECISISGFDISNQKEIEEKAQESGAKKVSKIEFAEIIDTQAVQSLMDDFYKLTQIPIGIIDIKGNVLVGTGWQDICTKFHRTHPEACKHCIESDTKLSLGVPRGEYKLYKCKNNMWDIATPIIVEGQHVANIFLGQFFFDDEPLDYELFRAQARKYSFNEEEYLAALEKVPRLSRKVVNQNMSFFMKLANMLSQLSYSNIKLAQTLANNDALLVALQESERRERARSKELSAVLDAVPVAVYISHDPQVLRISGNRLSYEWLQLPTGTNFSKSASEGEKPEMFKLFKDGREMLPEEMPSQRAATGREINDCELDIVSADGKIRHVLGNARPLRDEQGNLSGSISAFIDITERKKAEEALRLSNLYNRSLIETSLDPLVTIGHDGKITDVNTATEQVTGYSRNELIGTDFSDYFTEPEKAREGYQQVFKLGEVRDYPLEILHKDRHITPVLYNASVYRDENDKVIGVFAAARDITERKLAEEKVRMNESRLVEAQRLANVGSWEWDVIKDNIVWSEQMYNMFERSPKLKPLNYNEHSLYFTPDSWARLDNAVNKALNSGETYELELEQVRKDGVHTWQIARGKAVCDKDGNIIGLRGTVQDITERKQMEEQTRQRAEEIETVMEVAPVAIWIGHDPQCHTITGNRMANEFYEAEIGENVSANVTSVRRFFYMGSEMTIDELPMQKAAFKDIEVRNEEIDVLLPGGEYKTLLGSASPLYDAEGNVRGSVGSFIDITERKKAETKLEETLENLENLVKERTSELQKAYNLLKESEKGLAEAQRMAHIGNWDWNLVTGEVFWSKELYRIFGHSPQKSAATFDEFLNYVHPDDRDRVYNSIKKSLKGESVSGDYRIILANGEERIVHTEAEVFYNEGNNPLQVKGTVQDITEIKRVEEQIKILANIVESSNDAIGTISLAGIIESWNQEAEYVYGYPSEEILGKHVSILAPSHLNKETIKLIEEIKHGKKVQRYETVRLRKDRKLINISITLSPVFDSYGKLIAVSFISRDITKRKEAEEALRNFEIARKKELHHRIKNNLQVISSLLDLQADLFKGRDNIKDSEVLKAFKQSIDRVISIALIHEELYKGKNIDQLNFSQYIKELVNNLLLTYRLETDISLDFDMEENIFLEMDTAIPLGIVINEIISNSFKHAFRGMDKGEIIIRLHRDKEGYKKESCKSIFYILQISDNGVGIPEDINIEELDSLGLQIITSLVDQLNGRLEIKRKNGTEFSIKFNVAEKSN